MLIMAEKPDDPLEMKGRRPPPEETEGGMQDTIVDDAKRGFGMQRQAQLDPNESIGGAIGGVSGPIPEPMRVEDFPAEVEEEYRNSFWNVLKEKVIITDPEFFKNVYFEPRGGTKKGTPLKLSTINAVKYKEVKIYYFRGGKKNTYTNEANQKVSIGGKEMTVKELREDFDKKLEVATGRYKGSATKPIEDTARQLLPRET